jgi:hypothetical protein
MAGIIMAGQTSNYNFDYPTSTDYVKDGATAIQELADDVDATLYTALGGAYPGLKLIKSQTIGTGVSSITVSDAFNSTFDNYKIIISGGVGSAANYIGIRLGSTTSGYAYSRMMIAFDSTTINNTVSTTAGTLFQYAGYIKTDDAHTEFELLSPNLAKITKIHGNFIHPTNHGVFGGWVSGTTQYTAFTVLPLGATLTGGTISVYGYAK